MLLYIANSRAGFTAKRTLDAELRYEELNGSTKERMLLSRTALRVSVQQLIIKTEPAGTEPAAVVAAAPPVHCSSSQQQQ
jgi:hypothetical protein